MVIKCLNLLELVLQKAANGLAEAAFHFCCQAEQHFVNICYFQSKSSLDQMESQSADAEAPPPPKPDLQYSGLPPPDTEGEGHIFLHT